MLARLSFLVGLWLVLAVNTAIGLPQQRTQRPGADDSGVAGPDVTAAAASERIRFAALGLAARIRLEVLNQGGDTVYDSEYRKGSLLDWKLEDGRGRRLPDGIYGCVVTVEGLSGRRSYRSGAFSFKDGAVSFGDTHRVEANPGIAAEPEDSLTVLGRDASAAAILLAHDGKSGIVSSADGLSFRVGDSFSGRDVEYMRLTADGRLSLGARDPGAKLDVDGLIRTSEGIQFPDGTIQRTAAAAGILGAGLVTERVIVGLGGIAASERQRLSSFAAAAPATGSGTLGRVNGTEGASNTFYGVSAGASNAGGTRNSFFGVSAGAINLSAGSNSFFGDSAGSNNNFGASNSFFGSLNGFFNSSGFRNSFFGDTTGYNNTTGSNNSFFGFAVGLANQTEGNNTFIGAYADGASGVTNGTAIGYRAKVQRPNSLVLGGVNGVNGATEETFVGIGTTYPDRQLTVEGSQALGRFTRFSATNTLSPALLFERARGTQAVPFDILTGDFLGKVQVRGRVNGTMVEYGALAFIASGLDQTGRFAFLDRDIATERMSILNTGNVGIGTSSPTDRLHVVGNVRVQGAIVTNSPPTDIPDYVFEPDYELMDIDALEQFILREKHLPNIPAASAIKEKGLDLGEFQMKLLEKTEELTLYTVRQARTVRELQKTLDGKDAEIASLKSQNSSLDARVAALEEKIERLSPPVRGGHSEGSNR